MGAALIYGTLPPLVINLLNFGHILHNFYAFDSHTKDFQVLSTCTSIKKSQHTEGCRYTGRRKKSFRSFKIGICRFYNCLF